MIIEHRSSLNQNVEISDFIEHHVLGATLRHFNYAKCACGTMWAFPPCNISFESITLYGGLKEDDPPKECSY